MARVLICEPHDDISALLELVVRRLGHEPVAFAGIEVDHIGIEAAVIEPGEAAALIVARKLRANDVPVIMLTARTQELEKVRGLSAGADDYVAKPFGRQELLARVQALLRRSGGKTEVLEAYADDFVQIDYAQRRVIVQGRDVQLTPLEFKLLAAFVQNPNQVLSRDQLLELVWGDPYGVSGDQVKLYVGYLRRKLVPDAPDSAPIETVRGFGYRYRKT